MELIMIFKTFIPKKPSQILDKDSNFNPQAIDILLILIFQI